MAKIETFLKTGELGPLVLGISSSAVMDVCGQPDGVSRKSNPLILQYGRIQLTFTRTQSADGLRLQDILVSTKTDIHYAPLCSPLSLEDFPLAEQPTKSAFLKFAHRVGCSPISEGREQIQFASGVTASFDGDVLSSLRLSKKEAIERPSTPIADEREPTLQQIHAMIEESQMAGSVNAARAALLMAWAAMEALLRRAALTRGIKGRSSVVPQILIRELFSTGFLSSAEMRLLEEARQVRMAAAHGLSPLAPNPVLLQNLISLARTLLMRSEFTSH